MGNESDVANIDLNYRLDQGTFTPVSAPLENYFPTGILQWNLHHTIMYALLKPPSRKQLYRLKMAVK